MIAIAIPLGLFAYFLLIYMAASSVVGGDPFWFLRKVVYLTDCWGEVRRSREHTDANGVKWAPVYGSTMTGHVVLLPNGATRGESSYIRSWSYTREPACRMGKIERRNARFAERATA